jgi:hypothetical protein
VADVQRQFATLARKGVAVAVRREPPGADEGTARAAVGQKWVTT